MATSTSLRLLLVAAAVLLAGNLVSAQTSLSQLLTLPPPDSSAIPNLMQLGNCLQPGGKPSQNLFQAIPNNDQLPFIQTFPELAGPMLQITCDDLKKDAMKAQDLITQLATGQISPQEFIKKMLEIDPHIKDLLKALVKDAKKTLDNIIKNLPDGPLKQMLQMASDFLGQVLQDPVKALTPFVQAAQQMFQSMSPQLQQYLLQAGGQVLPAIGQLAGLLTGPPPPAS